MDREQFDRLSRLIAAARTRRETLRLLVSGAILGAAAGVDARPTFARDKSRKRSHGKAQAQVEPPPPPPCPSTCNQICSSKAIQGGANLTKCDLSGRDLEGVNLGGANLTQACFGNATLRDVSFRGANLSKTCLCGADLAGADFRGSNVTKQQLACAQVACDTILPNGKSAAPCPKGFTCCNHLCVPTAVDPTNCGACGHGCRPLQVCRDGRCLLQAGPCLPPETDLQGAIDAAASGDVLTLCEGRFRAVHLVVTKNLGIVGAGRDKTFLDGQNQEFVLIVQGGASGTGNVSVTLISLTVTGSGGGRTALVNVPDLVNNGPMPFIALSDVEVSNNAGTGLVNEGSASIGNGTRITNNTNSTFNGGGIYQAGLSSAAGIPGVSVSADSSIDHNTAQAGGGIFLADSGTTVPGPGVFLQSASIVHDNSPNNCATQDPNATIPNCIN